MPETGVRQSESPWWSVTWAAILLLTIVSTLATGNGIQYVYELKYATEVDQLLRAANRDLHRLTKNAPPNAAEYRAAEWRVHQLSADLISLQRRMIQSEVHPQDVNDRVQTPDTCAFFMKAPMDAIQRHETQQRLYAAIERVREISKSTKIECVSRYTRRLNIQLGAKSNTRHNMPDRIVQSD